jgi:hypothetical protein
MCIVYTLLGTVYITPDVRMHLMLFKYGVEGGPKTIKLIVRACCKGRYIYILDSIVVFA